MSRSWNGADLVSEFSALLGDTSTAFQSRVLGWINDIQMDILTRHDWNFLKVKGQKVLTASSEEQNLFIASPGAPAVATSTGGSLTDGSTYNVYITFFEGSTGHETLAGTASADASPSGSDLQIDVSSIPISPEPLVTARRVYLQKDSGEVYFQSEISDNTTTTATISSDTTSTIEPPDYIGIRKTDGNPFIESSSQLRYRDIDQLRLLFEGTWATGTPEFWSPLSESKVLLYPSPSSAFTLSFYYLKLPKRIFNSSTSQPDMPIYLKQTLKSGVIAMGYEYRDRDGQENKRGVYERNLSEAISNFGSQKRVAARVRDVVGSADGFEV